MGLGTTDTETMDRVVENMKTATNACPGSFSLHYHLHTHTHIRHNVHSIEYELLHNTLACHIFWLDLRK